MSELYTMQRYLQVDRLKEQGLNCFDAWAGVFGEIKPSLELSPEGTGYQMKTRFANFFNLPELINMFKEVADIKTPDVLKLPVPKTNYHNIVAEPSEYQKEMIKSLAKRAEKIRNKSVSSKEDNMLNITTDGKKLALDQRLANPLLPDEPNSKVNICINNVFDIWKNTTAEKSAQMIFCDLSTPRNDGSFSVYNDIKNKLINKGIPENQIAFIHDCGTDEKKLKLFTKVRNGEVRVLLGSTNKMGTGANCQQKLKAVHHLDCPYRPADLQQRNGRIIRQGNENKEIDIYNYVTKGTFDAFLYQIVENKQKFISQIMTNKSPLRVAQDIDKVTLNYAQIKALASDNPKIKEKIDLDIEVNKLRLVFAEYQENKRNLQRDVLKTYPEKIKELKSKLKCCKSDIECLKNNSSDFIMTINNKIFSDKKEAETALIEICSKIKANDKDTKIGNYMGFDMYVEFDVFNKKFNMTLKNNSSYKLELGNDIFGNITRINNVLNSISDKANNISVKISETEDLLSSSENELNIPFPQLKELEEKETRLAELNKELSSTETEDRTKQEHKRNDICM